MSILVLVLQFVFQLAALVFILRVLLQAMRADFYNPLSKAVVSATDRIAKPLRVILPPLAGIDLASVLIAWLIGCGYYATIIGLSGAPLSIVAILLGGLAFTIDVLLYTYLMMIFVRIIASYLAPGNYNPILDLINQLVEPIFAPLRRVIPPFGPLDLTPMVVILLIFILLEVNRQWLLIAALSA